MFQRHLVSSAAVLVAIAAVAEAAPPPYRILDLTPDGYTASEAFDVNSSGDAVGIATKFSVGSTETAFFYYDHSAGTSTAIGVGTVSPRGAIVGTGFRRAAINDSGQIAGTAMFVGGVPEARGFIYSGGTSGTFTSLGTFFDLGSGSGLRPASDALDINTSGVATGTASSGAAIPGSDNLDIYTGTSIPITDIDGDLTALTRSDFGRAINDAGKIVGSNQDNKATLFSGAAETDLLAGSSLASASASVATDLNDSGLVTGHTTDSKSFVYDDSDSSVTTIPFLGTGIRIFAKAINEDGDVVGWADRDGSLDGQGTGFVYTDGASHRLKDSVVDLAVPAVTGLGPWEKLGTAWGINDDGWIVGRGFRRFDGETFPNDRAYLLIPVPEPTGVALLTCCGLLTAAFRKRRD